MQPTLAIAIPSQTPAVDDHLLRLTHSAPTVTVSRNHILEMHNFFYHERRWRSPSRIARAWVVRQPPRTKVALGSAAALAVILLLWLVNANRSYIFLTARAFHAAGIAVLIYKLVKVRTCAGLSLKSQELTAVFLVIRLYCKYDVEYDIYRMLDSATLITTLWVVYMMRVVLKTSYMEDRDNCSMYHVVIPCALIALFIHPTSADNLFHRALWAFGCNLETVSLLPQLRLMQNTKIVESLTAHYVFALAVSRFLNCVNWIIEVADSRGTILIGLIYGFWPGMVLLSGIVQTFILADFCYYYVKRCPYTKHFDGALEEAAAEFYPNIKFVRVECPKYPGFCVARQRKEYPFIEIFHNPEEATNQAKVADPNITKYSVKVLPFNYDLSAYGFREFFKKHDMYSSNSS